MPRDATPRSGAKSIENKNRAVPLSTITGPVGSPDVRRGSHASAASDHNNAASSAGGVYCIFNAAPEITDCVFDGNTAYSFSGGAMLCYDNSNPTVTDCTFTANTGFKNGGAMILFDSSPVITGCTFDGNESFE